jgi:hypothetical protein
MELSHFPIPHHYERISTSNEVVFSEGKDLIILRSKDSGVVVFNSLS